MTNAANIVRKEGSRREKKKKAARRRVQKVKGFNQMGPVVQDGFLFAQKGDTVYLNRSFRGDEEVCCCTVMSLYENGDVSLYDETRDQWFMFNLKDKINLRSPEIPERTVEQHLDECKMQGEEQLQTPS